MRRILAFAALSAWALPCSPAPAATVTSNWTPYSGGGINVTAAPGEQNQLIGTLAGDMVILRDPAGLQPAPPCFADDPTTVRCPYGSENEEANGLGMVVLLGDGDDTFTMPRVSSTIVYGQDGNDVITVPGDFTSGPDTARLHGGPGDDRLDGTSVEGGPGNDVLISDRFDFSSQAAGVDVDLASGIAASGGEVDRLMLRVGSDLAWVEGGAGPDVIRAAPGVRLVANGNAGDDVVDGGSNEDLLHGGPGNDVVRGGGQYDHLIGDEGDDRLDGGAFKDQLAGGAGDDTLVGGAGRDRLNGDSGVDRMLARDAERDEVICAYKTLEPGDRATVDVGDAVTACRDVQRSGRPRLELHGLIATGKSTRVLVASCPRAAQRRACAGRIRFGSGRSAVTRAIAVEPGRRARIGLRFTGAPAYTFRLTLRTGQVVRGTVPELDS